ncbi:MAG: DUF177 domain-containing protein [Candidatus Fermentibacteraceae bacterium]|nr:DUF177 domain-containing protein [Candidatus Fermentibacteraceae bacterium]MBN2608999.1 DUF177 domain-containing protein [Candidatus Fermentibacteraceae bacterium]
MNLDTETLVLDLRSLSGGVNTGTFEIPMKSVSWSLDEAEPADDAGTLHLSVDLEEGTVICIGRFDASFITPCARCLQPVRFNVSEGILRKYTWVPDPSDHEDIELIPDTGFLDLLCAVREAVVLSMPGKPLCSADCPGIDYN